MDFMSESICVFTVGVSSKSRFDVDQPSVETQKWHEKECINRFIVGNDRDTRWTVPDCGTYIWPAPFLRSARIWRSGTTARPPEGSTRKIPWRWSTDAGDSAQEKPLRNGLKRFSIKIPPMIGPLSQRRVFCLLITRRRYRSKLMAAKLLPCAKAPLISTDLRGLRVW